MQDWVKTEYTSEQQAFNLEQERQQAFLEEAGIEDMDANKLRKTMLSAEEARIAKQEQLEDIRIRKCRKPDWDEYVDAKRRWGKALHHSDILSRLHKLIPGIFADDGMRKGEISLYVYDKTWPFRNVETGQTRIGGTVYLGWMEEGWSPEYEVDLTDDVGVAIDQIRGWRTVLLRLMCRRQPNTFWPRPLISEDACAETFGDPTQGITSSNFRYALYRFRHTSPARAKYEHALMEAAAKYRYA